MRLRIRPTETAAKNVDTGIWSIGTDVTDEDFPSTGLIVGQNIDADGRLILDVEFEDSWEVEAP